MNPPGVINAPFILHMQYDADYINLHNAIMLIPQIIALY